MKLPFKVLLLTIFFYTFSSQSSFAQNFKWVKLINGIQDDRSSHITKDSVGNLITVGFFQGTVQFNSITGPITLTNPTMSCITSKYNSNGDLLWARAIAGSGFTYGQAITVDSIGNIYITGHFTQSTDFNFGGSSSSLATSAGSRDIFIASYNSQGQLRFANGLGGTGDDIGYGIAANTNGNFFVTGHTSGVVDLNPSATVSSTQAGGGLDAFVAKYDSLGRFVFFNQLRGSGDDLGKSVCIGESGSFYASGWFHGTVNYTSNNTLFTLNSAGNSDAWISKYNDQTGDVIWSKGIGGTGADLAYCVQSDAYGQPHISGNFQSTVDFDPSPLSQQIESSSGQTSGFTLKLSSSSAFKWVRSFKGNGSNLAHALALDKAGNVYTTGFFSGTTSFSGLQNVQPLTSNGSQDVFVVKHDSAGSFTWNASVGGIQDDLAFSIINGDGNDVVITGYYKNTVDFDPGAGVENRNGTGGEDYFLLNFLQPVACDSFIIPMMNYEICLGDSAELRANGRNVVAYTWLNNSVTLSSTNTANTFAFPDTTTTYIVQMRQANGCIAFDTTTVTVKPSPSITITGQDTLCEGQSVLLSATPNLRYNWFPTSIIVGSTSLDKIEVKPLTTSTIFCKATDLAGCSKIDSLRLVVLTIRQNNQDSIKRRECLGTSVTLTGPTAQFMQWDSASVILGTDDSLPIYVSKPSTYRYIINSPLCGIRDTIIYSIQTSPNTLKARKLNNVSCTLGSTRLQASGGRNYVWTNSIDSIQIRGSEILASPLGTAVYYVQADQNNGCKGKDSVTVFFDSLRTNEMFLMPTAFSPNKDGLNDCFGLKHWGNVKEIKFSVYNRLGQLIFFTNNAFDCWDGKFRGFAQPAGSYVYQIIATTSCGLVQRQGTVVIVR